MIPWIGRAWARYPDLRASASPQDDRVVPHLLLFSNLRELRTAQRLRQRAVAEVDRRPPDDAPLAVDDESEPTAAPKEGEPIAPGIMIDATLVPAGDRAGTHQRPHLYERHAKPFCYELGWNFDVAIDESNPGQGPRPLCSLAKWYF